MSIKSVYFYLPAILFLGLFSACRKENINYDKVVSTQKIWTAKNYSSFTDLIIYNNKWYCVFREAISHVGSNGTIRILESDDGDKWKENSVIIESGRDLRDPKFFLDRQGKLFIHALAFKNQDTAAYFNLYWALGANNKWGSPDDLGVYNYWLWRIKLFNDQFYSIAYSLLISHDGFNKLSLFYAQNLDKKAIAYELHESVIELGGCPSEAGFQFLDDRRLVVIVRRDCDDKNSYLGVAQPPYNQFTWHDLGFKIQSPNMLIYNNVIYVAGRVYKPGDKTSVYILNLNENKLDFYTDLKSDLDTGYPGMLVKDGYLYISYYSSDGLDYRAIFLSKVKLKQ
ncbi:MAG: hypothetical protein ACOH2A_06765 [Sphingobacteriaceae bacterium]